MIPNKKQLRFFTEKEALKHNPNWQRQAYKKFCKRKQRTYKDQFPRIGDYYIVEKYVKEWSGMDFSLRWEQYCKQIEFGEISSASSSSSKSEKQRIQQSLEKMAPVLKKPQPKVKVFVETGKKKEEPKVRPFILPEPKVQVFVEPASKIIEEQGGREEEEIRRINAQMIREQQQSIVQSDVDEEMVSEQISIAVERNRAVMPTNMQEESEYMAFYKYYSSRLSSQHRGWTKIQLKTIIDLLWKKKKLTAKQKKRSQKPKPKPISGYEAFKREKLSNEIPSQAIHPLWLVLPFECKKYWEEVGKYNGYSESQIAAMKLAQAQAIEKVLKPSKLLKKGAEKVELTPLQKLMNSRIYSAEEIRMREQMQAQQRRKDHLEQQQRLVLSRLFSQEKMEEENQEGMDEEQDEERMDEEQSQAPSNPFSWMNRK